MKTLILNGSPKKNGDTVALINEMKKYLKGDIKTISVIDNISPCIDCRHCWSRPGCALNDDMQSIYPYLEECDNIVLASPVWFSELSGPLLNLASRCVQMYYASKNFRGAKIDIKKKNGVLILAGGEPGTEVRAAETAHTIFKFTNALPCAAKVFSMDTNNVPAQEDRNAMNKAREAAELLNSLYDRAQDISI